MDCCSLRDHLKHNPIIGCACDKNIEKYLPDSCLTVFEAHSGEQIFSESGQKKVGILLSGTAIAEPVGGTHSALLRLLRADDIFGIANLYSSSAPFPSIITAKTVCRVLFIDASAFISLIENDKCAQRAYLTCLSDKIVYLNRKIATLTAGPTEKKLASFLAKNEKNGEFALSLSMSAIADMLNIGRASLYRAFDALSASGLIIKDGKKILIPDKNALLNIL